MEEKTPLDPTTRPRDYVRQDPAFRALDRHDDDDDDLIVTAGMSEREIAIRRRVHRLAEFYQHAMIYVVVNTLLWAINAWLVFQSPNDKVGWWAVFPTLGWGIGLAIHGFSVIPSRGVFSADWEERKVKELLERERP